MTDIINLLATLPPDHELVAARQARPDALANAQRSFEALLEPVNPGTFTYGERYAVATYVAGVHQVANARTLYSELLLDDAPATLRDAVLTAVDHALSTGPYGTYRESGLVDESEPGGHVTHDAGALGERLAAAFDLAHLLTFHPRDARPETIDRLTAAGWSADDVVSLAQLVSFLAFQLRVVHGLQVLSGRPVTVAEATRLTGDGRSPEPVEVDPVRPERFVRHSLGWTPWVAPVDKADLSEEQLDSLIRPERADMPYFRLLARDPAALKARTLTDLDIFYNTDGGLSRADREWSATVTSRFNGCVYCASVHAARAIEEGGEERDVDTLLADGADAAVDTPVWAGLRDASVALTRTPMTYGAGTVEQLRKLGLDTTDLLDHLYATAFFNWANRLMLGLGEPEVPARFR